MRNKPFHIIIAAVLLSQCNSPTKNKNAAVNLKTTTDSCCNKDNKNTKAQLSETSEITCPKCGHKKTEKLPTDVCVIKYTCENCKAELTPKMGDCCVFCTYGTHKCPSKQ